MKTKYMCLLSVLVLLAGCVGENSKDQTDLSKEGTEKIKTGLDASIKTEKPVPAVGGNVDVAKEGSFTINYHGEPPVEKTESHVEKTVVSSSVFDYSLRELHEKVSGWYWAILVISAILAWKLYNSVKNSQEGRLIMGGLGTIHVIGQSISTMLQGCAPGTAEHNVLGQLQQQVSAQQQSLNARNNPNKPFNG